MFNEDQPTYLPPAKRILVIGDVHGDLGRLTQSLIALHVITSSLEWVAEPRDTIVVQMGDQVDSRSRDGRDGREGGEWERVPDIEVLNFMNFLDKIARVGGGRALSMIGNHELMNVVGDFTYVSDRSMQLTPHRAAHFLPGGAIASLLAKRNIVLKIGSCIFCHGGLLPRHLGKSLLHINMVARKFLRNEAINLPMEREILVEDIMCSENGILWTRAYSLPEDAVGGIEDADIDEVLEITHSKRIITGHNTVSKIQCIRDGRIWLTDAMFSRAYGSFGSDMVQVLELLNDGNGARVLGIKTRD